MHEWDMLVEKKIEEAKNRDASIRYNTIQGLYPAKHFDAYFSIFLALINRHQERKIRGYIR